MARNGLFRLKTLPVIFNHQGHALLLEGQGNLHLVGFGVSLDIVEGFLGNAKERAAGLGRKGPVPVICLHGHLKGFVFLQVGHIGAECRHKAEVFKHRWQQSVGKLTDEPGDRIQFSGKLAHALTTRGSMLQDEFLKTVKVLKNAKEPFFYLVMPFTDNALAFSFLRVEHGVEKTTQFPHRPTGLGKCGGALHDRESILRNVRENLAVLETKAAGLLSIRQKKTAEERVTAKRMDKELSLCQLFFRERLQARINILRGIEDVETKGESRP